MNKMVTLAGLLFVLSAGAPGVASAATSACPSGLGTSGFVIYDGQAVETASDVRVVETDRCSGFGSSASYDPQLSGEINRNPTYRTALRRGGYPTTDIYGATLNGDTLIVYIHDKSERRSTGRRF